MARRTYAAAQAAIALRARVNNLGVFRRAKGTFHVLLLHAARRVNSARIIRRPLSARDDFNRRMQCFVHRTFVGNFQQARLLLIIQIAFQYQFSLYAVNFCPARVFTSGAIFGVEFCRAVK